MRYLTWRNVLRYRGRVEQTIETLKSAVMSRVVAHRGEFRALAEEADVSLSWLSKFANGKIPNPTFESLRKVSAALDARESEQPARRSLQ